MNRWLSRDLRALEAECRSTKKSWEAIGRRLPVKPRGGDACKKMAERMG